MSLPSIVDYSPFATLIRCQGSGGCGGMSVMHITDILKEMEYPYTPDLSGGFMHYVFNAGAGNFRNGHGEVYKDTRIPVFLNQVGVMEKYGSCPETSLPSNYDLPAGLGLSTRLNSTVYPSNLHFEDAKRYRIAVPAGCQNAQKPRSADEIKQLLFDHGPLLLHNLIAQHVTALVGYNDDTRTFKYIDSAIPDTVELDYDRFMSQFSGNSGSVNWFANAPSVSPDRYTARIRVRHNQFRRDLVVGAGVDGWPPVMVWNRPGRLNVVDNAKELYIDIPLPAYAENFWPPRPPFRWYVCVRDHSSGATGQQAGTIKEFTIVKRQFTAPGTFRHIFGAGDGIFYAIDNQHDLYWFKHEGWEQGTPRWRFAGGQKAGSGWNCRHAFAGPDGVIYMITHDNRLLWYKHLDRLSGTNCWENAGQGKEAGRDWDCKHVFAETGGVIYRIGPDNKLYWFKHHGRQDGTFDWENGGHGKEVGFGWDCKRVFAGAGGIIYRIGNDGKLYWFKHLGYQDGVFDWANDGHGVHVGTGWTFPFVFAGPGNTIYGMTEERHLFWYRHPGAPEGIPDIPAGKRIDSGCNFKCNCSLEIYSAGQEEVPFLTNESVTVCIPSADLRWYKHPGWKTGVADITGGVKAGFGWTYPRVFSSPFGTSGGTIYAVAGNFDLLWFKHTGTADGSPNWISSEGVKAGFGWSGKHVFAAGEGVIYRVNHEDKLLWFKHIGLNDGSFNWANGGPGAVIGSGWGFQHVFAGPDGVIYAVCTDGTMLWYKHLNWREGTDGWAHGGEPRKIGTGWNFQQVLPGPDGVIYALDGNGRFWWYRHDGWRDGSVDWANGGEGKLVGTGWGFRCVLAGSDGVLYGLE